MSLTARIRAGSAYGLVLARGGSKGLPGKNIRTLGGRPLIAWSVVAGKLAKTVERVICSTDDKEIADAARRAGAEVPFLRPSHLATDSATDFDVFTHCIEWLAEHDNSLPEFFVQLRPTTPFRLEQWIDEALNSLSLSPHASSVRSVAPTPLSPYKMWREGAQGELLPALEAEGLKEAYNMPRQALPEILWHTGQLDIIRTTTLLNGSMTGPTISGFRVPIELAVDIDTLADFLLAEMRFPELMPKAFRDHLNQLKP